MPRRRGRPPVASIPDERKRHVEALLARLRGVPERTIARLADVDVRTLGNWYRLARLYAAEGLPEAAPLIGAETSLAKVPSIN
jgi:hypothetical protein